MLRKDPINRGKGGISAYRQRGLSEDCAVVGISWGFINLVTKSVMIFHVLSNFIV